MRRHQHNKSCNLSVQVHLDMGNPFARFNVSTPNECTRLNLRHREHHRKDNGVTSHGQSRHSRDDPMVVDTNIVVALCADKCNAAITNHRGQARTIMRAA